MHERELCNNCQSRGTAALSLVALTFLLQAQEFGPGPPDRLSCGRM